VSSAALSFPSNVNQFSYTDIISKSLENSKLDKLSVADFSYQSSSCSVVSQVSNTVILRMRRGRDVLKIFLLILITSSSSSSQSEGDADIWKYFLSKYSNDTSRNFLTPAEISTLVLQNQNSSHTFRTSGDGKCQCGGIRVPEPLTLKSPNCDLGLTPESLLLDLKSACPRILYVIDNPNCLPSTGSSSNGADKITNDASKTLSPGKKNEAEVEAQSKPTQAEGRSITSSF